MKISTILAFLTFPIALHAQEEIFPPAPLPEEHFSAMKMRSPFVLPTPETATTTAASSWADDYRIASVLLIGEDKVVLVLHTGSGERFPVRTKQNAQGLRLISLNMSPNPHEVSAVIAKGDEHSSIRYDDSILSSAPNSVGKNNPAIQSE